MKVLFVNTLVFNNTILVGAARVCNSFNRRGQGPLASFSRWASMPRRRTHGRQHSQITVGDPTIGWKQEWIGFRTRHNGLHPCVQERAGDKPYLCTSTVSAKYQSPEIKNKAENSRQFLHTTAHCILNSFSFLFLIMILLLFFCLFVFVTFCSFLMAVYAVLVFWVSQPPFWMESVTHQILSRKSRIWSKSWRAARKLPLTL